MSDNIKMFFIFLLLFNFLEFGSGSQIAEIKGQTKYKIKFCTKHYCEWVSEKTKERITFYQEDIPVDSTESISKLLSDFQARTSLQLSELNYETISQETLASKSPTRSKTSIEPKVYFFRTRYKKADQSIWLTEKIEIGKKIRLVQHFSERKVDAKMDLDFVKFQRE